MFLVDEDAVDTVPLVSSTARQIIGRKSIPTRATSVTSDGRASTSSVGQTATHSMDMGEHEYLKKNTGSLFETILIKQFILNLNSETESELNLDESNLEVSTSAVEASSETEVTEGKQRKSIFCIR